MQIDFHHAATYVIARYAGFTHEDAAIVAHSAQYVDDASTSGFIRFSNGMRYQRAATAHAMSDPENLDNDDNTTSWLPFHFFPAGEAGPADSPLAYYQKLVCRPDSQPARAMMAAAIATKGRANSLYRLGIAAHVFVDTFAHQGFAGIHHPINTATQIKAADGSALKVVPVPPFEQAIPPIGHGQVGTFPDQPYLIWSYVNHAGETVQRNNPKDYLHASGRLCEEFQRYLGAPVTGLTPKQVDALATLFASVRDEDGEARHEVWLKRLASGHFEFGPVVLEYEGKAAGSWKESALGAEAYAAWKEECLQKAQHAVATSGESWLHKFLAVSGKAVQEARDKLIAAADAFGANTPIEAGEPGPFLVSHYRHFHDAAKQQRHEVLQTILPSFEILAA
jgi:hypothetical protein